MGNQPSSPQSSPVQPSVPPPIPPICDLQCQKDNQLKSLKTAMDTAFAKKESDPEAYEQSRIQYYTLLKGHGWLVSEKERIAKNELEPILSSYRTNYNTLKSEQESQKTFLDLANHLKSQETQGESNTIFLNEQLEKLKNDTNVLNRMKELQSAEQTNWNSIVGIIIDVIITILGLLILYSFITKLSILKGYITGSNQQSMLGARR
jgi:hypothetical protein